MRLSEAQGFRLGFGKYKGRSLGWVARTDAAYARWLRDEAIVHDAVRRAAFVVLDAEENPRRWAEAEDAMDDEPA